MNIKMRLFAAMALAAAALAAPAAAWGDVTLKDINSPLKEGADVIAASNALRMHTEAGEITCQVTLHLDVKDPGPEHVVLELLGSATSSGCALATPEVSFPVTSPDTTLGILTLDTWGHGTVGFTASYDVYFDSEHTELIAECHFEGPLSVQAHEPGGAGSIAFGPSSLEATPAESCPTSVGEITGSFALKTANGTPVEIDYHETE